MPTSREVVKENLHCAMGSSGRSEFTCSVARRFELISSFDEPSSVLDKIEKLAFELLSDLIFSEGSGSIAMLSRTIRNVHEDEESGALVLGCVTQARRLNHRSSTTIARQLAVMSAIQKLLLSGKRISQRELFYLLIELFDNQQQLNNSVLDVSATLGVPRFALNIGAATRGVLAGCLRIALRNSLYYVDCEHVGTFNLLAIRTFHAKNGWPIPGDILSATSVAFSSTARYILEVIEKFGIFSRLVQDRFYEQMPCILLCGKGYPSIATRAMASLLAQRIRIPVLGIADFNPHGLALLQCYYQGSIRSSVEGSRFVCDMKWLALRSSHVRKYEDIIGADSVPLTRRDETILDGLLVRNTKIRENARYSQEVAEMRSLGKYELQWLYGHEEGTSFLGRFLLNAILHADYF